MRSVSADWVLPVDGPPIKNGYVEWSDGAVTKIGESKSPTLTALTAPAPEGISSAARIAIAIGPRDRRAAIATGTPTPA